MSTERNLCIQTARRHYYAVMNRIVELKKEVNAFASKAPIVEDIRKTNGLMGNTIIYTLECERKALSLLRTIERNAQSEPYHLLDEFKKLEEEAKSITPQKLQQLKLVPESPAAMAFFIGFSDKQVNELNRILGEYIDFEVQLKVVQIEQNSLDKVYQIQYAKDENVGVVGFMEAKRTFIGENAISKLKLNPYEGAAQIKYSVSDEGYYIVVGSYSFILDEKDVLRPPVYISSDIDGFIRRQIGMNFAEFRMDLKEAEFKLEAMEIESHKPNAPQPEINLMLTAQLEEGNYRLRNGATIYVPPNANKMVLVVNINGKFVDIITSEDENKNIRGLERFYPI